MMSKYFCFFDFDGSTTCVKILSEDNQLTHTVYTALVVDCIPRVKCSDVIDRVVKIIAVDIDLFIFSKVSLRRNTVYFVSGGLTPVEGYLGFVHGLPTNVFYERYSAGYKEPLYRQLYYSTRAVLEKIMNDINDIANSNVTTIESVTKKFAEIYENYNKLLQKIAGGLAKEPEALIATETLASMVSEALSLTRATAPSPPTPPTAPSPPTAPTPPKVGIRERLSRIFRAIFRR